MLKEPEQLMDFLSLTDIAFELEPDAVRVKRKVDIITSKLLTFYLI